MATASKFRSLVGGEWIDEGTEVPSENPSDLDHPVGVAINVGAAVVDQAVDAAIAGGAAWRALTSAARADALERIASELFARTPEFGALLAREEGKTLRRGRGRGRPRRPDPPLLRRRGRAAAPAS